MANEINLACMFTFYKTFENGFSDEFVKDRIQYSSGLNIYVDIPLYYSDNDSIAGRISICFTNKTLVNLRVCYRDPTYYGGKYDMFVKTTSTFAKEFGGKNIYFKHSDDKIDIIQKPDWTYDIDVWNTYFKDIFNSNWDNVGKYYYEEKSKLPFDLGSRTLRMDDNAMRWVILKDGMLMNLENVRDRAEFDDTVTLRGIPIEYILLHMMSRLTNKFESKVETIQKLRDRIGNKYTKSVIVMQDNGDLRKYTFTVCHAHWGATELTIDEIQKLVDNPNAWNGDSLKLLPAK